ncbi:MAG: hypothetical protein KGL35_10370, partial [Bradyrhizobium sp.]|nr:hypothetical protein [Bradyrhizobium sp.]
PIGALTDQAAAKALNVGERSVERAKTVQRDAVPEIAEAVDRGRLAVSAAAEIAAQPAERQAEILAALPRDETGKLTDEVKKALAPIVKELRREKVDAKKERRAEREAELGRKIQAMPDQRFGVAIEDFEWDHEAWSRETGLERSPSMHYETAADAHSPEEIVARCAERFKCLAEDCVLFKWTTIPHLAIAIHVLELQGFRYVTHLVWDKRRMGEARGTGYWFTGEHEIVLVGVRGKVVAPAVAHFRSVFTEPVGAHSKKPENLHRIIEFHWPNVPKVEFNARRARAGWFAWGFDAPAEASALEPPAPLEISEYEALKAIGDFCHPRRAEICTAVGADYAAKGFAVIQGGTNQWILREAGRARLNELEAERRASAPPAPAKVERDPLEIPAFLLRKRPQLELGLVVPPKVDVIDDHVQTRLPVNDVEISEAIAMRAIEAGEEIDSEIARHLIGKFWLHCPTQGKMRLTEEGRAALASFVDIPMPAPATEARA